MATQDDILQVKASMGATMQRASDAGVTDHQINNDGVSYAVQLVNSGQVEHAHIAAAFLDSIGLVRDAGWARDLANPRPRTASTAMYPKLLQMLFVITIRCEGLILDLGLQLTIWNIGVMQHNLTTTSGAG